MLQHCSYGYGDRHGVEDPENQQNNTFFLSQKSSEYGGKQTFDDGDGDGYGGGGGDNSNDAEVMKVEVQSQQMAFTQSPSLH